MKFNWETFGAREMNTRRLGWVYSKEDVDEWIENHKANSEKDMIGF